MMMIWLDRKLLCQNHKSKQHAIFTHPFCALLMHEQKPLKILDFLFLGTFNDVNQL